jgi:hypothetical protein
MAAPRTAAARVLTVIGNRPQFIKAAAVSGPLRAVADEVLVHTGQHYDAALSQIFFDELALPRPEHRLELGGGSNTDQTARMLAALGRSPARSPRPRPASRSRTWRRGCAPTTARCPRSSTAC